MTEVPWKRKEVIGDCVLYLGDCSEVMPTLGKVDAVDNADAVVYSQTHEKPAKRQHRSPARSDENMGTTASRNLDDVCQRAKVATGNGRTLRGDLSGLSTSAEKDGNTVEIARQAGSSEWPLQARARGSNIPNDDRKGSVHPVRCDGQPLHPSQGWGPLQQHAGQSGGDVHELPFVNAQDRVVAFPQGWAILTDPPYGIGADQNKRANKQHGKAAAPSKDYGVGSWDARAPDMSWAYHAGIPAIIWGGNFFAPPASAAWLVWDKENGTNGYADCELAWSNLNQAVRRLKWRWAGMLQQDMTNKEARVHPTQKPVALMKWCLGFLPDAQTILDPFMGSGTTGVACVKLGRKGIGIELDPDYFEIACKRVREAYAQPDLFVEQSKPVAPVQEGFDL